MRFRYAAVKCFVSLELILIVFSLTISNKTRQVPPIPFILYRFRLISPVEYLTSSRIWGYHQNTKSHISLIEPGIQDNDCWPYKEEHLL